MATSVATAGYGCLFKIGDGAGSEVFATIAEVTSIDGPGLSMDTIEVTHMESPNAAREYIAGLKDGGEISLELNLLPDDTNQTALRTCWMNRTLRNFKVSWTDTTPAVWSFAGFVTSYQPSAAVDDKLSCSVTIKLTGVPTFA